MAIILLKFLWCRPLSTTWTGECSIDVNPAISTVTAALNISSDLLLLTLFVSVIASLKIRNRALYASIFLLLIGSCTAVMGAVRYAVIWQFIKASQESINNLKNVFTWTTVEIRLAILAACLPAFRVFLRRQGIVSVQRANKPSNLSYSAGGKSTFTASHSNTRHSGILEDFAPPKGSIRIRNDVEIELESRPSEGSNQGSQQSLETLWPPPVTRYHM